MTARGIYNKLLELRESKDLAQFHWSPVHKTFGMIETFSTDTVCIRQISTLGEEDGFITIPTSHMTHIVENSQEVKQIKQYLIQKSFKL